MATDAVNLLRGVVLLTPDAILPHLLKEVVVMSLCKMFTCVTSFQESRRSKITKINYTTYVFCHKPKQRYIGVYFSLCDCCLINIFSDPDCLLLCCTIMALMQSVVERVNCASKAEVVFASLQLHWESFGKCYFCIMHGVAFLIRGLVQGLKLYI